MSDLINRQAAIDAINTWDKFGVDERSRIVRWHEGLEPYVHLRDVLTAIVNLPPAQPTLQPTCNQLATGCISRQAVIDACGDWYVEEGPEEGFIGTVKQLLERFPSVQPERKRGEWVLQSDDYHEYYECDQCGIAVGLDDVRNFCCNCGADMRGEQDE